MTLAYVLAFFVAHLAFIIADNFSCIAGLIGRRTTDFFPVHCRHRSFIAAAYVLPPDALKKGLCDRSATNWRPKPLLSLRLPSQLEAKMHQS